MKPRLATVSDLPALIALGREMHAEAPRMHYTHFDEEKVRLVLTHAMDQGCVYVTDGPDGSIDGCFAGVLTERWYSRDVFFTDLAVFVRKTRRGSLVAYRLIREALDWCQAKNLRPMDVQIGISTGIHPEQTGRLYEALGFKQVGGLYELERF